MTDGDDDPRSLSRDVIERAVAAVAPEWQVADATLADGGHLAVYVLDLDAPDGPDSAVLKATPPEFADGGGVHAEPRLLALVADRTSIPVPTVYGVVDERARLPTPCFLMEHVDRDGHVDDHRLLDADALARLARTTGRFLAELHDLDVVDRFGTVAWSGDGPLDGGRPRASADAFAVVDGGPDWPDVVADWVDLECSNLESTRFADCRSPLRAALDDRVRALETASERGDLEFDPVLARIDHGLHNVVLADEGGDVASVIDWAFALATTPGYDLAVVADVLTGGVRVHRDDHPDRRNLAADALLDGYRERAGRVPVEYGAHGETYQLLATVRAMNHLQRVLDDEPPAVRDVVARGLRERARALA
ncbi:phosphotransferase [Halorubellus sp. JP-L1]|uniref:phosphotransferase family protein n=1 Tax=Halorubellus sp. JP-L1 TaxID=2715753 RepID=UPI0014078AB3|nr:phosphotransferase [Halorubellus sp. JP-L1]NHN41109.1 phosphotransferase [Halorubellus sp. JP-L1]